MGQDFIPIRVEFMHAAPLMLESVARSLNMSDRTLRRRLTEHALTY